MWSRPLFLQRFTAQVIYVCIYQCPIFFFLILNEMKINIPCFILSKTICCLLLFSPLSLAVNNGLHELKGTGPQVRPIRMDRLNFVNGPHRMDKVIDKILQTGPIEKERFI
jgi:hypothetical protein